MYRTNFSEIPICNKTKDNSDTIITPTSYDIFLNCNCMAFEYRSHLPNCQFWNTDEDQPYYPGCLYD